MKPEDVIPAGSEVPEKSGQTEVPVEEPETPTEEVPKAEQPDEAAALKEQLANAQKLIGRQGKELGELRKSYEELSSQLSKTAAQNDQPGIEDQLAEIQAKVDSGDMDFGEALAATARLSAQMGAEQASQAWAAEQQKRAQQEVQQRFLAENPDFPDLVESGALDEIMRSNPMHDQVSAYYAYKAEAARREAEEALARAREEGKQEGAKLAAGQQKAGQVIGKSGTSTKQNTGPRYMTPAERHETMLAALQKARSG